VVRAHPALLLVVVPVALIVIATLLALTILWTVITLALIILGQRSHACRGPRAYSGRRRFRPAHEIHGGRGTWL
jgi:hypothetical protein